MPGDQSRSTVEIAEFTIDTTQTNKVPIKNGDRCCVNETTLNCDAVLTLLDKNNSGNDETLFSLSINNYDSRINDEMKNSLENYKNVIYYNSQLKKFYSSYSDDHKKIVKQKISHILILGKTETLFKSEGIYTFTIDKTILIYEASHANITSAKESHPVLTMFEYFNLIYIDWFSLLLSDFYKEFKKIKSVMPQEVLSARAASTEADSRADSESEADSEADFLVGERRVVEGVGEEEGEGEGEEADLLNQIDKEKAAADLQAAVRRARLVAENAANKKEKGVGEEEGEGEGEEADLLNQIDKEKAAADLQAAVRRARLVAENAANKKEKIEKNINALKRYNDEEPERRKLILERQAAIIGEQGGVEDNRNRIISVTDIDGAKRSLSLLGGKKKGKKTKKVKLI
jgi:hypothetical protein